MNQSSLARSAGMHVGLWSDVFAQAVRRDLQFRSQTYTNAASGVAELLLGMVPVLIITNVGGASGGWTGPLGIAVVGMFGLTTGLMDCFVSPNLRKFDSYVRRGDLDLILIRPVNAPLYAALRWVEPAELGRSLAGLGLLSTGLFAAGVTLTPSGVASALGWAIVGLVAYSTLWANLVFMAFWVESAEPINDVAAQLRTAGQYPVAYFPQWARTGLGSIIPASLLAAVPVQQLVDVSGNLLLGAAGLIAGLLPRRA